MFIVRMREALLALHPFRSQHQSCHCNAPNNNKGHLAKKLRRIWRGGNGQGGCVLAKLNDWLASWRTGDGGQEAPAKSLGLTVSIVLLRMHDCFLVTRINQAPENCFERQK